MLCPDHMDAQYRSDSLNLVPNLSAGGSGVRSGILSPCPDHLDSQWNSGLDWKSIQVAWMGCTLSQNRPLDNIPICLNLNILVLKNLGFLSLVFIARIEINFLQTSRGFSIYIYLSIRLSFYCILHVNWFKLNAVFHEIFGVQLHEWFIFPWLFLISNIILPKFLILPKMFPFPRID